MADLRLLRARNRLADGFKDDAAEMAGHLVSGVLTVLDWARAFASLISHGITAGFLLGRGTDTLDERSSGIVSGLIQTQYTYAGPFAQAVSDAIDAGSPLSEGAIASRSGLYSGSVIQAHSVGEAERWNVSLDHYPGDGSTPCMGNCRCNLDFEDDGTIVRVYWRAVDDKSTCSECAQREQDWNPLVLTQQEAA